MAKIRTQCRIIKYEDLSKAQNIESYILLCDYVLSV